MTAKEFLKQYEYAERRLRRLEIEYEDELTMIDAIRSASDNDGMPHGSTVGRPTEEKALRLADKRLRIVEQRIEATEKRQMVFDIVNSIDGIEGDLLFERYVRLKKWEEICVELHYSWNGIHAAHRRALAIVDVVLNGTHPM